MADTHLRDRIADLEETVRQQRDAFAPRLLFPVEWRLKAREAAMLSALYVVRGSVVSPEAMILWVEGVNSLSIDVEARGWVGIIRGKVAPYGITIEARDGGYRLSPEGRAIIARAIGDELSAPTVEVPSGASHRRGWTDAEKAIVKAGYESGATLSRIQIQLQAAGHRARSLGAISAQAHMLDLTNVRAAARWMAEEDAILRTGYEDGLLFTKIKANLAAAGFRRNRGAIGMRLIALGLSGERVRTWSDAEIAIVRSGLRDGLPYPDIQVRLEQAGYVRGRTSVYKLCRSLGASRRAGAAWTAEHEAILRRRYSEKASLAAIASELGRPISGISSKAHALGLKQRFRPSDRTCASPAARAA